MNSSRNISVAFTFLLFLVNIHNFTSENRKSFIFQTALKSIYKPNNEILDSQTIKVAINISSLY